MPDNNIRRLFALLSVCVWDDQPLARIVLETIRQSDAFRILSTLDQYVFLSDEGREMETRLRNFKLLDRVNCSQAFVCWSELDHLISEFKLIIEESVINADKPMKDHSPVHILDNANHSKFLAHRLTVLNNSKSYKLWQSRNEFVYLDEQARQLKQDMDAFAPKNGNLAEITDTYNSVTLFRQRFNQNRSAINTLKRHKEYLAEKKRSRHDIFWKYCLPVTTIVTIVWLSLIHGWNYGLDHGLGCDLVGIVVGGGVYYVLRFVLAILSAFIDSLANYRDTLPKALFRYGWMLYQLVIIICFTSL